LATPVSRRNTLSSRDKKPSSSKTKISSDQRNPFGTTLTEAQHGSINTTMLSTIFTRSTRVPRLGGWSRAIRKM
jgi:hypothetical protein